MFAPEPLPQTARQELLDPPTAGYNPYGRAVGAEEPPAQVPAAAAAAQRRRRA